MHGTVQGTGATLLPLPLALACETRCASADHIFRWPPRPQRGAVAWRGAAARDGPRPAQVSNGEVYYKAVSFYLEEHPDLLVDLLKVRGPPRAARPAWRQHCLGARGRASGEALCEDCP